MFFLLVPILRDDGGKLRVLAPIDVLVVPIGPHLLFQ